MGLFKVIGIAFITICIILILREIKPEMSIFVLLGGSILILLTIIDNLSMTISSFNEILSALNFDKDLFKTLFKIVGIGYITEFSATVCKDTQNNSIADKIIFSGKIIIFSISLPIFKSIIEIVMRLI